MGIFDFLKKSPRPLIEDEEITVETNKQHISQDGSYSWNDDEVIPFEILPDEVQEQFRNFYDKRTRIYQEFYRYIDRNREIERLAEEGNKVGKQYGVLSLSEVFKYAKNLDEADGNSHYYMEMYCEFYNQQYTTKVAEHYLSQADELLGFQEHELNLFDSQDLILSWVYLIDQGWLMSSDENGYHKDFDSLLELIDNLGSDPELISKFNRVEDEDGDFMFEFAESSWSELCLNPNYDYFSMVDYDGDPYNVSMQQIDFAMELFDVTLDNVLLILELLHGSLDTADEMRRYIQQLDDTITVGDFVSYTEGGA